jgi:hypothetical protein
MRSLVPVLVCLPLAACAAPALPAFPAFDGASVADAPPEEPVMAEPVLEGRVFPTEVFEFIDTPDDPLTLEDLVKRYNGFTDWGIEVDKALRERLEEELHLGRSVTVPEKNVVSFIETILSHEGLVVIRVLESTRVDVRIAVPKRDLDWLRQVCMPVPVSRIDDFANRPALLVATVVELPGIDVLKLSGSLNRMIGHSTTGDIIPIPDADSLLVLGTGQRVARRVEMLHEVLAASAGAAR